jgi:dTDP-4-dehydrorhamnose reductase
MNTNKILLTGASSYVGARMYIDLKDKYTITGTYHSNKLFSELRQLNLKDKQSIKDSVKREKPEVIIHVANHASPRPAFKDKIDFIELNKQATKNLIKTANEFNCKIIFISSFAAIEPDNIYGKLKHESEELIKQTKAGYVILRPSLIIGGSPNTTNDRPHNRLLRSYENKDQVAEYDTSWTFQPSYVGHLSDISDQVIAKDIWDKTFPVVIDKLVTQYQLAKDIIKPLGITVKPIDKQFTYPTLRESTDSLKQFSLKPSSYQEMINTIIKEIRLTK